LKEGLGGGAFEYGTAMMMMMPLSSLPPLANLLGDHKKRGGSAVTVTNI
jgi:hypothetical protein